MQVHELKTVQPYFDAVVRHDKTFEVRKNDRSFAVGDALWLREWNPLTERYGAGCVRGVSYILPGGQFGVEPGYVVLGLQEPDTAHYAAVARYRSTTRMPAPGETP
jgi:hypothetical protein